MGYRKEIYFSAEEREFIVKLLEEKIDSLENDKNTKYNDRFFKPYKNALLEIKYNEISLYSPKERERICECVRDFFRGREKENEYEIKYYRSLGLHILNKCEKCHGKFSMLSKYY